MGEIREIIFQRMLVENNILSQEILDECLKRHQKCDPPKPLAIFLIEEGYINRDNLESIVRKQKEYFYYLLWGQKPERFGSVGVREGFISQNQLNKALAIQRKQREKGKIIRIGQILQGLNILSQEQVEKILFIQGKKVLYCKQCQKRFNIRASTKKERICPDCKKVLVSHVFEDKEKIEDTSVIELPTPDESGEDSIYATEELKSFVGRIDEVLQKTNITDILPTTRVVSKISQKYPAYMGQKSSSEAQRHPFILVACSLGTLCTLFLLILFIHIQNKYPKDIQNFPTDNENKQPDTKDDPKWNLKTKPPPEIQYKNTVFLGKWGNNKGEFASPWNHNGKGPASFALCEKSLYVLDQFNSRIYNFTYTGELVGMISLPSQTVDDFVVDDRGNCLVLDSVSSRGVIVLDSQGMPRIEFPIPPALKKIKRVFSLGGKIFLQEDIDVYEVTFPVERKVPGVPYRGEAGIYIKTENKNNSIEVSLVGENAEKKVNFIAFGSYSQISFIESDISGRIFIGLYPSKENLILMCYSKEGKQIGKLSLTRPEEVIIPHWINLTPAGEIMQIEGNKEGLVIIKLRF